MAYIPKKLSLKEFLLGDFDRDKVKNIDDPFPFNKKKNNFPDAEKDPSFYHKARFGGFETKLSDVLLKIERHNNLHAACLRKFIKQNPGSKGRIKTIPSTINKLAERGLTDIRDIAGISISTKDRKAAYKRMALIKKKYKTNPKRTDDYYKNPKNQIYYALHTEILTPMPIEIQVASDPMRELAFSTHTAYKKNQDMNKFIKKGKQLYKMGF
jgi:ppGpp synthetase/RelA/SpoT-type nucleotidyltranferase